MSIPERARRSRTVAVVLGLAAGCAVTHNTPVQEYVWEMGHNCEHTNTSWQLDRVDAAGNYWIKGVNATSGQDFAACMKNQFTLHPYQDWLKAGQKTQ